MNIKKFNVIAYRFFVPDSDLQDAILYYHRDLTADEIELAKAALNKVVQLKNRGNPMRFILDEPNFSDALQSLRNQIVQ